MQPAQPDPKLVEIIATLHRQRYPHASIEEVTRIANQVANATMNLQRGTTPEQFSRRADALGQLTTIVLSPNEAKEAMNFQLGMRENFLSGKNKELTTEQEKKLAEDAAFKAIPGVKTDRCWSCHNVPESAMKCSGCLKAIYCNTACQKRDWKTHKTVCILSSQKT
ncbi:MAG: zinc finger MYND domain-containing protein [Verrucomicrobia bacterium]|nr:zinc finger MYND domain-containing protein [Verrucomicrobiota bacterium]